LTRSGQKADKPRFPFFEPDGVFFVILPLLQNYNRADIGFTRGEGPYLFDEKGERYLDFGTGLAVNLLGHAHPHLVAALREQAGKLWHTSNLYRIPEQERLAKRLVENSFADTVFFCNSGAEAVECAIKMARHYHFAAGALERYRLITFEGAFHGRTLATIAAGGTAKYLEGFGPKVDGFDQVPVWDLDAAMRATGPQTAGILVEPIQGEVGIRPPPRGMSPSAAQRAPAGAFVSSGLAACVVAPSVAAMPPAAVRMARRVTGMGRSPLGDVYCTMRTESIERRARGGEDRHPGRDGDAPRRGRATQRRAAIRSGRVRPGVGRARGTSLVRTAAQLRTVLPFRRSSACGAPKGTPTPRRAPLLRAT
jgi:hypothetical protein